MDKILSIRKNAQIFSLFIKIQEYQQSANRTEIVNVAIEKAIDDRKKGILKWTDLPSKKIPSMHIENDSFPDFIQLRVDADKYQEIMKQIKQDFLLERDSPAPFVVKLLLINYLLFLESNGMEIIRKSDDTIRSREEKLEKYMDLDSLEDKLDAIYELLLEIKYGN